MSWRALLILLPCILAAADWPQFLGPSRNGVYPGTDIAAAPKPALLWKRDVGQGFSAPSVSEGRVVLFHRTGGREIVEALDAATGKALWSASAPTAYRDDFGFDEGPRAAPAIAGGRVYTFGAEGVLQALDFSNGKRLWSLDANQKYQVAKGFFGAAVSPLVEGGAVLLNIGGRDAGVAAFHKDTGKPLWTATSDEAGYASPTGATIGGVRYALFFTRAGLSAVDPASGKVRFQFPWRARSNASVNAATPLVVEGDLVFLSASYGSGAVLLRIEGGAPRKVWASDDAMSNHYATCVYRDGYLYGFHGRQEEGPSLRCVELRTGRVAWSVDQFRAGTVSLAGDRLLIVRENGELVVAPASPKEFRPVSKAPLLPGTVRAYPAIADGRLYVRNEKTLAAYDLRR